MNWKSAVLAALAVGVATVAFTAGVRAQAGASVWDGIYTEAQATRGQTEYASHCAACHGANLSGTGEAPSLSGGQFVGDFNGETVGDIFDRIRTTMPMDGPGSLSRDQYADILSFILKSNNFPAGAKELDRRSEFLKAIKFESINPHAAAVTGAIGAGAQ